MPKPLLSARTARTIATVVNRVMGNGTTVTLRRYTGASAGYNDPTYAAPETYAAFVTGQVQRVTTAQGSDIVSQESVIFEMPGPPSLSTQDELTMSDGTIRPIVGVFVDEANPKIRPSVAYL